VALVRRYLDGFRSFRHLLMKDLYALTPYPQSEDDWDVVQFLDPETGESVVLAYRVRGTEGERLVMPRRLVAQANYGMLDPFEGTTLDCRTGLDLMESGLRIQVEPESARVVHLRPAARG
jgi:hypothetical protein